MVITVTVDGDSVSAELLGIIRANVFDRLIVNGVAFRRDDGEVWGALSTIAAQERELLALRQKIAFYEERLPMRGEDGKFTTLVDHRFNDDGICIRCGEDAEEWDAGCVEQFVVDLESICTSEFVDSLERVLRHAGGTYVVNIDRHKSIVEKYLEILTNFYVGIEFAKMGGGDDQEQNLAADSTG